YLVVEHVYTNARLAALRAIHGIDATAVELLLGRRYDGATLTVRATPETTVDRISAPLRGAARPGKAAFDRISAPLRGAARPGKAGSFDRIALAARLAGAGVAVTTRADGDAIVIETGALATSRSTGGIGRYSQFNNYAAYHAL